MIAVASIGWAMGISPEMELKALSGRPFTVGDESQPVLDLFTKSLAYSQKDYLYVVPGFHPVVHHCGRGVCQQSFGIRDVAKMWMLRL
jgi:hypothetical protein